MSNFWGQALGVPQQPQPAPAARPNPGGYSPSPFFTPSQPVQAPSEAPEQPEGPEVPGQWGDVARARQLAQSAKDEDTCPECFSGNYFQPKGHRNMGKMCFDCGYPVPQQSGAGGLPSDSTAPTRPAKQLDASGASNFHGQTYDPAQGGAGRIS